MLRGSDPDSHSRDPNISCRCMYIRADESATEMLSIRNSIYPHPISILVLPLDKTSSDKSQPRRRCVMLLGIGMSGRYISNSFCLDTLGSG